MSAGVLKISSSPGRGRAARFSSSRAAASAPGLVDYALLLGLGAIWGAAFPLIKVAVEGVQSWTMTAIRLVIAALFMLGLAAWKRERFPQTTSFWWVAGLTAFFGNLLPFVLIAWGESKVDSGVAAICMATMPLMTVMLAHFLLPDDPIKLSKLVGVVCGLAGLAILIGPLKLEALAGDGLRTLAFIVAAACYALNAVFTRKYLRDEPRYALAAAVMVLAVILIVPLALLIEGVPNLSQTGQPQRPIFAADNLRSLAAITILAVVQTAIAQILMFMLLARQGASFFSQVNFFVPVFGVFSGWLLLSERLPGRAFLALVVILVGVAVVRMWDRPPVAAARAQVALESKRQTTASRKKRRKQKRRNRS
jgi:drug/metabolite transporter (DMT)-like permease